jgi:lipopolysaccharide biosynthesis glycosyltransferase
MSVAEDSFVDEARRIAQSGDAAAAVDLLNRRPAPTDLGGLSHLELLAFGDLNHAAGNSVEAARSYRALAERSPDFYWPHFQLGRIARDGGDAGAADAAFQHATELAPEFGWSWYELAVLRLQSEATEQLDAAISGLLGADPVGFGAPHLEALTRAAHHLFERNHRPTAVRLYEFLWERGVRESLVQLRRGEGRLAIGDAAGALELLESLDTSMPGGEWAGRSLAQAYTSVGRIEDAAAVLGAVMPRAPRNEYVLRDYVVALLTLKRFAEADDAFDTYAANLAKPVHDSLLVTLLSHSGQFEALRDLLSSNEIGDAPSGRQDLLQAIYKTAYDLRSFDIARDLVEAYAARYGESIELRLCRLNIAFATQSWAEAEQYLATIGEDELARHLELRVKRFELCCFTGDLKGAAEALTALEPLTDLPAEYVPAVLRFYAETNAWHDLYELGMSRLESFDYAKTGYILFRAIRKTAGHVAALTEIERLDDWEKNPSLRKLRTIVMEDMVHNGYMLDEILLDPNADNSEALQHRLFFKMRVLRGDAVQAKDYAIYFCTNDSYLCATLVSLTSLVENNRELMNDASLFIAVDSQLADRAEAVTAKLSEKLKVPISIIRADQVVPEDTKFQAGYGMFTGGHTLADAAYYRIYVANQLAKERNFKRALYIDSDTVVLSGLEKLFWIHADTPLMARLEVPRPEVEAATRMHDLAPGTYFNSGVLYFDLGSRRLREHLDRTVRAIADPECKLLFQDQCALNVGFKGAFSPLRENFNYFVKPDGDGDVENGVIVHFLDRPKPWDPAYPGAICRLWYTYWHKLAGYVGSEDALQLYRAANRG